MAMEGLKTLGLRIFILRKRWLVMGDLLSTQYVGVLPCVQGVLTRSSEDNRSANHPESQRAGREDCGGGWPLRRKLSTEWKRESIPNRCTHVRRPEPSPQGASRQSIAAVLFSGERLHFGGWLALVASTFGAGLIALSSKRAPGKAHASVRGDLLVVLSMFAAIAWILILEPTMRRHSAVMVTAFVSWIGTLILTAVVITTSGVPSLHYSKPVWVAVAEQGLLATASTTVLWNWGLKRVPTLQAGIFVNWNRWLAQFSEFSSA